MEFFYENIEIFHYLLKKFWDCAIIKKTTRKGDKNG